MDILLLVVKEDINKYLGKKTKTTNKYVIKCTKCKRKNKIGEDKCKRCQTRLIKIS